MSPRWVRRRLATGLIATICAFTLAPVLAGLIGAPAAKGDPIDPVPTVRFINPHMSAMIGQDISFDVEFHNSGPVTGFGPFVDLTLPLGHDLTDGISYTVGNATYLTKPVADWIRNADGAGHVTHPFAVDPAGHLAVIDGLQPNQQMVVLRLPFGSFTPTQPAATVHVTVHLSDHANVGYPLQIGAVGGFQFGRTALDDPTNGDPTIFGAADTADVTPTIMTVSKTFHGPTNVSAESATGPDFPLSYTLTVTVAPGQTVNAVTVTDALPDSIEYLSTDNPEQFASITEPDAGTTGGNLVIDFGTIGPIGNTASATFHFMVPRVATSSVPILDPTSGAAATSTDSATATGQWTPIDPADRDPHGPTSVTAGPATHDLTDRAISIQKSGHKIGGGEVGPDDILEWTIDLQVSDFFALNNVSISDLLSDGSRFDTNFAPTLSVDGNPYTLTANGMHSANFDQSLNPDGTTAIEFRVSDEIDTRGESGRLVGGCIDGIHGSDTPDCTANHDGATTAQIVFHSVVQRTYIDNKQVVEGDTLSNVASAFADVLDTGTFLPTGGHPSDGQADLIHHPGASFQIPIARGVLSKTIYAINGSTSFPKPVHVSPGDRVTYRLEQEFPASRTDDFSITDYLPLPIFAASTIAFDPVADATAPDAGKAKYGRDDTFHSMCSSDATCPDAPTPKPSYDADANSITFTYGNYALYPAQSSIADILFTVTVSTKPFADGLLLTNQARSQTSNSAGQVVTADAIVQVTLDQPVLAITKGVVGSDGPHAVYAPASTGPVVFAGPASASCPTPSDPHITNAGLLADPVKSDVSGLDAGDLVRFAVIAQDTGHAAAFNVQLMDTIPQGFRKPDGGYAMCITDGGGNPIAATNISDKQDIGDGAALFGTGIQLVDPTVGVDPDQRVVGALAAGISGSTDNTAGTNIAVITYTLQVDTSAVPTATATNTATLLDFTNSPTGDSHLAALPTDDASATFSPPAIAKTISATGQNNGNSVVIGEKVTYQVTLTVPEGTLPGARVVDTLPTGMGFAGCDSIATLSDGIATNDLATDVVGGFDAVCTAAAAVGQNVTFNMGTLVNNNTDNSKAETLVITYKAVALNSAGNLAGQTLQNAASLNWTGGKVGSVGPASAAAVTVTEPTLTIGKDASTSIGDAFDSITYTITITNPSAGTDPTGATAFDVKESDLIPAGMTYDGSTPFAEDPGGPTVKDLTVSGQTLTVTWDAIKQGETAVLHYHVKIDPDVVPSQTLPNVATLTWTSLPGDVPGERTGSDGPGDVLNNYATSDDAKVDVPAIAATKSIVTTDQDSTSGNNVVVGEKVTYRVELTIPEGVAHNARLVDTLPAGMAFVGCVLDTPVEASAGLTTDLAHSWADACNTGAALAVASNGHDVTFGLGNVTNGNVNAGTPAVIKITYEAVVLNLDTNIRGETLQNAATAHWEDTFPHTFDSNKAQGAVLTVVEPKMQVTKTASKTTGDAGDTITFEIAITNPSGSQANDAFDVDWTDKIPTGLNYVADSLKPKDLSCANPPTSYSQASAPDLSATWFTFPKGGTCTLTYKATLADNVPSNSSYTNATKLTWTSIPGAHNTLHDLSSYNDLASERTGDAADPGGVANDYVKTDHVTVHVNQPVPVKSVITTSEAGTTGTTNLAVGEIVRYRVYVTIPEGITDSVSIRDTLTPGLKYLNDNSTRIAFVTNGAGMTSSTLPDPSLYVTGNEDWITDPGNHPTYVLPPEAITAGTGYNPEFDLGNLNNADRDPDQELVVIEFNALVENVSGNVAEPTPTTLTDQAAIWASPPLPADQTPVDLQDSNTVSQTVVEPDMSMAKTITKHPTDAGDEIDYVITVTNASATAPAYDYHVTDTLPSALVAPPISISSSCATSANVSAGDFVDLTITEVAPSSSCTVTIKATVVATAAAGKTFRNSAAGTYTSLPGPTGTPNGDPGNATGSTTPGASGHADGERNGRDGLTFLNDYVNSDHVDQTLAAPSIVKNAPDVPNAPIGQETTFNIVVTLPEGTTRDLIVTDTLEDGLDFVSATPVTAGGLLAAPFSGTFTTPNPTPTVTTPDGSHHAYALDFGDTVVPVNQDPADDQFEIQVTVRVANVSGNQAGTVRWNSAKLTYTKLTYTDVATPVDVPAPDPQSVTVMEPDLSLTKSVSSITPYFGDTLTYTLTLSHGNGTYDIAAHDVTIDDTLPVNAGWTYAGSVDSTGCADAETVTDSVSGHVTATFTTFPLNHTCVITYKATIGTKPNAHLGATYTNNAVATWTSLSGPSSYERTGVGGINDYTDPADSTVTVTGVDLAITKDDGPAKVTAIAGDTLTYSIANRNNGNAQATNVTITEIVPPKTVFKTAGSSAGWLLPDNVTACPNNAAAGTVCHLNVGTLNATTVGTTRTFVVAVVDPIAAGLPDDIVNTATIADDGTHNVDATPEDNTATDTDHIPQADLRVIKTVNGSASYRPNKNEDVTYTVTVYNDGPDPATGVQVTDHVPAQLTYKSSVPGAGNSYNSGTGIWKITGSIASGDSRTLTITATASSPNDGLNIAQVTHSDDGDPDSTPNNGVTTEDDYATATTDPVVADMGVTKTVDNAHPNKGGTVTFTVTAHNYGPDAAPNVNVADAIPANLTPGIVTPSVGTWDGSKWAIGTLAAGAQATLTVVATVTTSGAATNTATVTTDAWDLNSSNDSASADISQLVNIAVSKNVDEPTPNVGHTVTFTVGVTNTLTNVANTVVIHDALPAGLTLVTATPSKGSYDAGTHDWTIATLGPSESVTMTMTATVVGATAMTNTASVASLEETQTSTDDDSASATVTPRQADLGVTKTVDNANPEIGDTVEFTVTVVNHGNAVGALDTATNVTVSDLLPAGLTYVSDDGAGTYVPGTGVWTIGTMAKDDTAVLHVTATVPAGGVFPNTATVHSDVYDPIPGNDSSTATVTTRQADIGVTKTVDNATPNVGATIHYTLTVTNHGPVYGVNSLLVRDLVPAGLTIVSAVPSQGAYDQGTGDWTIGDLASGASVSMPVTATVTASGRIDNTLAFVSMLQTDTVPGNNSATATINVPAAADLSVTKSEDTNHPDVGSQVTFTLTAHNGGPDDATNVAVADALPAGLTVASSTPSADTSYAAGTWTIGNLANGADATLTIVANVVTAGATTNTATISGSQYDPNSGNNTSSVSLDQRVNIVVSKSVDKPTPNVGDTVTFTIGVTNAGVGVTNTAHNVAVLDALPAGLTIGTATPIPGSYDTGTHVWTVGSLAPSATATMTLTATVVDHVAMTNTASMSHVDETQTSTADDSASATVTPQQADLRVTKAVDNAAPEIGDTVSFTISLRNNGPDTATNITLSDVLPVGLTYVSKTVGQGTYDQTTGVWAIGSLARNTTVTLQVRESIPAGGSWTNIASVSHSDQYDPVPGNNSASVTVTSRQADIGVTKTVDNATPSVGATIHYALTVTNHGPLYPVSSLLVRDIVPAGLTIVSATPSQGSYVQGTGNWTIGNLANGASATMTVTATVAASGHIDNTLAFVSMLQTDSNSANNTSTVGIDVQSAADLGVTKSETTNRPDVGSQVTFTLTAHNYGPDNATGVAVADALPGGLSLVSSTPSAGTSYAAGVWTIGNLANGAGATLSIVAKVTSAGAQTNTATISGSQYDPVAGNNSQSVSLDQRVNIALVKTVDKPTPNVGGTVVFTIVASNTNINTANNITIDDALPAGLTFVSAAPGVGSYDVGTNIWTIPDLEPLSSVTMTMTATVADHIAMTNTATLSHVDEQQSSTADDNSSATVTPQQADLLVGKSVDDPAPEIGDVVTFTVTVVNNNGPDSATNVTIGDLLPGGLTFVSKTPSTGTSYNEGTGVWTVGTLARNATATLQIRATVSAGGIHTNTATVTHSDQYDPGPGVNTASATVASRVADIAVAKVVSGSATPQVGENTSFLVTVTNNGPDTATSLIVGDLLPAALSYVSATPSEGSYAPGNGKWTIGTLASGAQATMTIVATVTASGEIDNTASFLSMLQTDSDDTNNSATATINVGTAADLAVTKTPDTTRPDVGSNVTFTITALNNGPDAATGVEVADLLPAGLTPVKATPSAGSWADGTWTIGNLGVGAPASQTLVIVAHVDTAGAITNNATISGTEYDPNAANNHDSATIDQRVHFVVTKTAAPADANVGTNTTFTIQVANSGPNTAHNVVVNDALPGGLTYVGDDGGGAYSGGVWTIPSIASGSSATLHVVALVGSQAPVTNTATIASVSETRSSTANDSGSATVTPAQADLAVTKTVDNGKPELGGTIVFTVAVHNIGPDDATGVTLGDLLPAGLTWVSDDGGVDYDHVTGVWTIGGLEFGATATLHVTATVSAKGDYTNTASITASDQYDPNTIVTHPDDTNNVASIFVTTRAADIGVTKTVDNANPAVGTVVVYTVTVINNGDDPASGLHVSDVLPAGRLTFVSATPSGSTHYDAVTGDWNVGALAVSATATLTINARVIDSGLIDNTAAVSALLQRDNVAGNDSATVGIDPPEAADLSLTKTVDNNTPDKDATVVFTLTTANAGPNNTTGVVVTDALPADLTYVSDDGGGAYDSATGHWTIGGLNKGAHATLHITATVNVGDKQITNEAEVTHSNLPDPDSTPGNGPNGEDDYASVILNAHGVADLAITKTISPTKLRKGDKAVYTIVLTNHGPQDATGVIVRDQLPSAVTYVSSTGGTYDSHTGAWTIGNLANGASATLKITVTIGRTGAISNTANVTAADQRDPVSSNNQFTAGISAAGPTPPVTVSRDSGPLPRDPGSLILGLLGIAFAAIALLGYAAMSNRNRRRRMRL